MAVAIAVAKSTLIKKATSIFEVVFLVCPTGGEAVSILIRLHAAVERRIDRSEYQ